MKENLAPLEAAVNKNLARRWRATSPPTLRPRPTSDAVCATYEKIHGVSFSEPVPTLGNARTADLDGGGRIGVRAPMHESEEPVVRPYILVDDAEAATKAAEEAGAMIAHPAMEIPGEGTFAIFVQGDIHHALWQD